MIIRRGKNSGNIVCGHIIFLAQSYPAVRYCRCEKLARFRAVVIAAKIEKRNFRVLCNAFIKKPTIAQRRAVGIERVAAYEHRLHAVIAGVAKHAVKRLPHFFAPYFGFFLGQFRPYFRS